MGIHDRPYYRDEVPPGLEPSWNNRSAIATIIFVCVGAFVLNMFVGGRPGGLSDYLALNASDLTRPLMWWRTLTYGFLHDHNGVGHLLWNMFGLWMLGRAVEERYGSAEFWRIYLVAVVACGFIWLVTQRMAGGDASLVGASGAVICIEMLFVLNFPRVVLMLFGVLPIQAWVLGVILIATNILSAGPTEGGNRVAYDVHITGIAFAFLYFYGGLNLNFLEAVPQAVRRMRRKFAGPQLRAFDPDRAREDSEEADRILDKIHRSGQDSLTRRERKFLERYSESVRRKKSG